MSAEIILLSAALVLSGLALLLAYLRIGLQARYYRAIMRTIAAAGEAAEAAKGEHHGQRK